MQWPTGMHPKNAAAMKAPLRCQVGQAKAQRVLRPLCRSAACLTALCGHVCTKPPNEGVKAMQCSGMCVRFNVWAEVIKQAKKERRERNTLRRIRCARLLFSRVVLSPPLAPGTSGCLVFFSLFMPARLRPSEHLSV